MTTEAEIKAALVKVAGYLEEAPELLPLFESLERDLIALQSRQDAFARARLLVASQKDMGLNKSAA